MSLMLKLLAITLLLNSVVYGNSTGDKVIDFLETSFEGNPNVLSVDIELVEVLPIDDVKDFKAYIVLMNAEVKTKNKKKNRKIKQKMTWFSNGSLITQDLVDLSSGISLKELIAPTFKPEHYKKENLIYGNKNAKYKVAIFSDPLCPYCKTFVPKAINYMKKYPNKFAVYYYHFPLSAIHPAAVDLVKAAAAAEIKGHKDVVLKMYKVKVDAREKDSKKILAAFNKTLNSDIKPADLKLKKTLKHYQSDLDIADALMVGGTPTMFFDGKVDKTKSKYKKAK